MMRRRSRIIGEVVWGGWGRRDWMLRLYFLSSRIKKKAVITTEIIFRAIAGMLELETEETTTANIKRLIVNSSGK